MIESAQRPDLLVQRMFDFALEERPRLRGDAAESESSRRVPVDTMRKLEELGALKLLLPQQIGGLEVAPSVFVRLLEALAEADAALGWCVMTGATTGLLSAYMPVAGAREIWTPGAITAGVFAPSGTATPAPGGYRVSGRWPFMSGCENASWCMGGARVLDTTAPELINVFFPSGDATRHDTWSTLGLKGTGSHDVEVSDLFIPEHRVARVLNARPLYAGPLFAFPLFGLLSAGIAGVALGIARAALADLSGVLQTKRLPGGRRANTQGHTQLEFGRAQAELGAGRALLLETCERLFCAAEQPVVAAPSEKTAGKQEALSAEQRAALRLAANQAVRGAVLAVDAAYAAAGGSAVYTRAPFEKHFRDIHTLTQHVMVQTSTSRLAGAVMLGAEVDSAEL